MRNKLITTVSTVAIFLSAVNPTFAASTIQISGNGAGSTNQAVVVASNINSVAQNNTASLSNNVSSNVNTGGNNTNGNTGGNVTVRTGNSNSQTTISNRTNINIANIINCACRGNCN